MIPLKFEPLTPEVKALAKRRSGKGTGKPKDPTGWTIPRIWKDETVFILGGGPSLNNVDFSLIKERKIIAVNNAYGDPTHGKKTIDHGGRKRTVFYTPRLWVDVCWFGDEQWFWWHRESLKDFRGLLVTTVADKKLINIDRVLCVHRGKPIGIETRPRYVSWNKSSAGSAINLAYHLGATTIVLLGMDMRRVDDKANWHDDHPAPQKDPYARFLKAFPLIKADAEKLGLKIINCTPGSAITQFPIMPLEDFLEGEE